MNAHRVRLEPTSLAVEPGREVTCTVTITNAGDVVDAYEIVVLGAAAGWTVVSPATVSLFPGAQGTARIDFRPPRSPEVPAGPVPFAVQVRSRDAGIDASVVEEGVVEVGAYGELEADLRPRTSRGRFGGGHRIVVTNKGNAPTAVRLTGSDDEQALRFRFRPATLAVRPGTTMVAALRARCAKSVVTGAAKQWAFRITAEAEGSPPVQLTGTMEQRPMLGRLAMRTVALGAIALVGLAVYSVKGEELRGVATGLLAGNRATPAGGQDTPQAPTPAAATPMPTPSASPSPSPSGKASPTPTPSATPKPPAAAPTTVIGSTTVAAGSFNTVRVLCPSGTQALSGGPDPANVLAVQVTSSGPVYADNSNRLIFRADGANAAATGWQVSAKNGDTAAQTIRAAVLCASPVFVGATTTVVATSATFGGSNFGVATATCPAGAVALGGGVDADNVLTMTVTDSEPMYHGTHLLPTASQQSPAPDGWQAAVRNDSTTAMKFKVAAVCSATAGSRTSTVVTGSPFAAPGSFGVATARCPGGAATVGGGVANTNMFKMTVTGSAPAFPDPNSRTLTRTDGPDQPPVGWQVSVRNDTTVAGPTTVIAICTTG